MGATGKKVKGRYSFIYVYEDGEWKVSLKPRRAGTFF